MNLECCGVRCVPQGLAELDGGRVIIEVRKDDIQRVRLQHGFQAPHPVLGVLIGCALSAVGYFPALHLIHWFQHGGVFFSLEAFLIAFVVFGVLVIFAALRRGYFLNVQSRVGRKRLVFRPTPDRAQLNGFLDEAERCLGTQIERLA